MTSRALATRCKARLPPQSSSAGVGAALCLWLCRLTSQSHALCELGPLGSVVRCHHRIVTRQVPLLPVLVWRHAEQAEIAFHGLGLAAVLERDDVVGCERLL